MAASLHNSHILKETQKRLFKGQYCSSVNACCLSEMHNLQIRRNFKPVNQRISRPTYNGKFS